ncbi:MAG: hypothetical protein AB7G34_12100 [Hyphomicrobiales bacterium]
MAMWLRMAMLMLAVLMAGPMRAAAAPDYAYPAIAKEGAALDAFLPPGWTVAMRTAGDLNRDSIDDVAAVLEAGEKATHRRGCKADAFESGAAPRILVILLGKPGGGFTLAAQENQLPARADEGGVFGDPLENLTIERGTLLLHHYGGSAWRWSIGFRFRQQDGGWFLIGYTEEHYHNVSQYVRRYDYNTLTSKIEVTSTGEDGKPGCRSCLEGESCPKTPACRPGEKKMPKETVLLAAPKRPLLALKDVFCAQDLGKLLPVVGER